VSNVPKAPRSGGVVFPAFDTETGQDAIPGRGMVKFHPPFCPAASVEVLIKLFQKFAAGGSKQAEARRRFCHGKSAAAFPSAFLRGVRLLALFCFSISKHILGNYS